MYQDIRIKHFRGFEDLRIEGLSQVNVFLGRNNSGKTSILEAVFLLTNPRNGTLPLLIGHTRGFSGSKQRQSTAYLWHSLDYDTPITLETTNKELEESSRLLITAIFGEEDKIDESIATEGFKTSLGTKYPTGLSYTLSRPSNQDSDTISLDTLAIKVADYLPSNLLDANTYPNLKRILEFRLRDSLIRFLSAFDSRILGVELIGEDIWVSLSGVKEFLPLQVVGDGLRRIVSIWAAIANPDNDIVLIDEIDNGIHHSSYRLLWEMILKTAKENNVQLFITTHSDESLMGLVEAHENLAESERAEAAIYSVAHTKSGAKAYRYEVASYEKVREGHVDPRN